MGQFTFSITGFQVEGDVVHLEATKNGTPFTRTVTASKLVGADGEPDPAKVAAWMLYQDIADRPRKALARAEYVVTTRRNAVTGDETVEGVAAVPLKADRAAHKLQELSDLATMTDEGVAAWVDTLAKGPRGLRGAVEELARLCVYLRDIVLKEDQQ